MSRWILTHKITHVCQINNYGIHVERYDCIEIYYTLQE